MKWPFLKLRRKTLNFIGRTIGGVGNPYAVVRNNLIEKPEFEQALRAFDDQDVIKAFEIFSGLAEAGDPAAQNNLGVFYETGSGLLSTQDAEAKHWYRKAAEQGVAEAQYNLAALLAADAMAGLGDYRKDEEERFIEAYMWLTLADEKGHEMASPSLPRLEAHMTEEQLQQAENRVQEWRSKITSR